MLKQILVGMVMAGAVIGCLEMSPAQVAASVQTAQCEDFIRVMKNERDKGTGCVDARKAAQAAEPLCVLTFVCPGEGDAGTADAEGAE